MSRINTNVAANSAYQNLSMTGKGLQKSIERLSSGLRIGKAADDAAGMAIANKLRADVRSLRQAARNAEQGASMLQVADGAVNTIASILDRLKELATQANSASVGGQADKLQAEWNELVLEIDRVASSSKFNGSALVNGTLGATVSGGTALAVAGVTKVSASGTPVDTYTLSNASGVVTMSNSAGDLTQSVSVTDSVAQSVNFSAFGITIDTSAAITAAGLDSTTVIVSGNSASFMVSSSGQYSTNDLVSIGQIDLRTAGTALNLGGLSLLTAGGAQTALSRVDAAIGKSQDAIGILGAAQNRFEYAQANVASMIRDTAAAESTIRDADMAYEMTVFTRNQILQQAGTAMLAQANQSPQSILQLLR